MYTIVIDTDSYKTFEDLKKDYEKLGIPEGYQIASVSNTGLPSNKRRITFLPPSAFKMGTPTITEVA